MTAAVAPAAPTRAVVPSTISDADVTAALRQAGFIEPESQSNFNRVTLNGYMFTFADGDVKMSNPKKGTPAFRCRILGPVLEYQAIWIDDVLAGKIDRPGDTGFCKSYFADPSQARKRSESGHDCNACPVGPWVKKDALPTDSKGQAKRCAWKGDLSFQLVDDDGTISDPTVHTLSMSTTSVIEFKGTAKETVKGSVSEHNFLRKVAHFGMQHNPENPNKGLMDALTAYGMGGVIADVSALYAESDDRSINWTVASFTPVDIIDVAGDTLPALPDGTPSAGLPDDDLPF